MKKGISIAGRGVKAIKNIMPHNINAGYFIAANSFFLSDNPEYMLACALGAAQMYMRIYMMHQILANPKMKPSLKES